MLERLEQIEKRYNEIKEKLSESDVIQDIKRTTELSKELSSLEDIVNSYSEYKTILSGRDIKIRTNKRRKRKRTRNNVDTKRSK